MNYFDSPTAAARYAKGRPYFHPGIIRRIRERLSLAEPVSWAMDVGCGTGMSTVALKEIAERIIGVDASVHMLGQVALDPRITYVTAPAEHLPDSPAPIELMTVSSAFHWVDGAAFLAQARRVMRSSAHLVVYDNYFGGSMEDNPRFADWSVAYYQRYPSPPRTPVSFDRDQCARLGFRFLDEEHQENLVGFSPKSLIDYLVTQSNIINVVEGGNELIDEVRAWLDDGVSPLFPPQGTAQFRFHGPIWYLRRME